MMSYFAKTASKIGGASEPSTSRNNVSHSDGTIKASVPDVSDFDATFHTFVLKKDAVMAPINRFAQDKDHYFKTSPKVLEENGIEIIHLDADDNISPNAEGNG
jgi:hypothetical protein